MRLYFVRHGESEMNRDHKLTGQLDVALTDKGRHQAMEAGEHLLRQGLKFDLIVASPLSRAYNTATMLAEHDQYPIGDIVVQPFLIERNFGDLQGGPKLPREEMTDEFIVAHGGESDDQVLARARQAIEWALAQPAHRILFVAHNGFGRALRAVLERVPLESIDRFANGQVFDLGEVTTDSLRELEVAR